MNFIDLTGASGTAYRFRLWPGAGRHSPTAGNFVVAAERSRTILAVGMLDDLSRAAQQVEAPEGALLYTRLNIGRQMREAEHADLIAAGHPEAGGEIGVDAEPRLDARLENSGVSLWLR